MTDDPLAVDIKTGLVLAPTLPCVKGGERPCYLRTLLVVFDCIFTPPCQFLVKSPAPAKPPAQGALHWGEV